VLSGSAPEGRQHFACGPKEFVHIAEAPMCGSEFARFLCDINLAAALLALLRIQPRWSRLSSTGAMSRA
jgi:hypothetical protein